jgi:small GTP-binding protein
VSFYLQPFIFAIEKRGVILIKSGFACLIGRPNVGKSTLLNQFIGHKVAIVSDKPQTTRNRILGILTTEDVQVVFIDTPGIHKPRHKLGAYMTRIAQETLEEVDLGIYVVDASVNIGRGEEYILKQLQSISTPVILVVNKIDLIKKQEQLPEVSFVEVNIQPRAKVKVVEKKTPAPSQGPCHIVAKKEGVIDSILVLEGQGMVKEGDLVKKGQVLISGAIYPPLPEPDPAKPEPQLSDQKPVSFVNAQGVVYGKYWYRFYGEALLAYFL